MGILLSSYRSNPRLDCNSSVTMSAENPPQFVYKIVPEAVEEPFPAELPLSELDRKDGFIHLSTAELVLGTCDRYFSHTTKIYLLKLDFAKTVSRTKWENGFPHLYGNFGREEIVDSRAFERSASETWSESLKRSEWLV